MSVRLLTAALAITLCTNSVSAATLHGRVKDSRCDVLARVTVQIRASEPGPIRTTQTLITDDSGNYTTDLTIGRYEICLKRGTAAAVCTAIDMPASGDKWVTTQLRDTAPDLSTLGNHAE